MTRTQPAETSPGDGGPPFGRTPTPFAQAARAKRDSDVEQLVEYPDEHVASIGRELMRAVGNPDPEP